MNKLNFTPFPELKTERLILRQLREADNHEIFSLRSDDKVNKYLDRPKQNILVVASEFISKINNGIKNNKWVYWAVSFKSNPKLIGTICMWNFSENKTIAEVGYELLPEFHGIGIMNEALNKIIKFGFNSIGLDTIEAYTHKDNINSTKLLENNDFVLDGNRKDMENNNNLIFTLARK